MPAPDNLISEAAMIPLIIDLQMLESHYQRMYSRPDVFKDALDSASNIVFEDQSVSRKQFEESYDYYASQPEVLFTIYEATLDTLNQRVSDRQQQPITQQ
ncbi:MAG: hypothetical protein BM555_00085 [Crocinitomix sp. MedPE-SWsnd]|nr:MAG: hypothetical protein BM555_00085 [Crocinitomix sp. MedPE-SWsnd]